MAPLEYGEPTGDPNLGDESARDLEVLSNHIEKHWGCVAEVFHEVVSEYAHIDLHISPANDSRPYHIVVTTGMSDRPMELSEPQETQYYCELLIALPKEWPIKHETFTDEKVWWPFRQLKQAARFPHVHRTLLWYGHTITNGDPPPLYVSCLPFCGGILSFPLLSPKEAWQCRVHEQKTVHFLSFVPLHASELQYAWKNSSESLFEKMDDNQICELLDVNRPACV